MAVEKIQPPTGPWHVTIMEMVMDITFFTDLSPRSASVAGSDLFLFRTPETDTILASARGRDQLIWGY